MTHAKGAQCLAQNEVEYRLYPGHGEWRPTMWYADDLDVAYKQAPKSEFRRMEHKPKPVVYVAHPVSGQCMVNVYKTVAWIRYLVEADPTRIYQAPWLPQVMAFPDTEGGQNYLPFERCLSDDKESLARCDEIILVGGRMSPGMQVELDEAKRLKLRITDMSQYATPSDLPDGFHLDPHAA